MQIESGTTLGSYEIVAPLGAGGMGEVYRARDDKLDREVAIKVLPEAFAEDEERLARFEREAKSLAALNHPNIATVHGFEREGDTHFLVMELVEGQDLSERIKRGPLPVDEAIPLFVQIAEGLEAAHEKGIVHRDLKPANIMVGAGGRVKILDFGLAKAMEPADSGNDLDLSQSPTMTAAATMRGEIMGTAAYMSPEQAKGRAVDKRSDIWSFGACLFESLTGRRPFEGEDATTVLARVVERDPSWQDLMPVAPKPVIDLVQRCLVKDPRDRLRDVGDARIEMLRLGGESSEDSESPSGPAAQRARWAYLAAGLVLGSLLFAGLGRIVAPDLRVEEPRVRRYEIPLDGLSPVPQFEEGAVALSPDGSLLALTAGVGPGSRVYFRSLDSLEMEPVPGTEWVWFKTFSPDGQWLLAQNTAIGYTRIPVRGGTALEIEGSAPYSTGASLVGGDTLVFSGGPASGLESLALAGGSAEVLTQVDNDRGEQSHILPQVLPDGRGLLFTVRKEDGSTPDVAVLSYRTGEIRTLVEGGMSGRYAPTGHLIYGADGALFAVKMDLATLETSGAPRRLVDDLQLYPSLGTACYSFSDDGTLAYVPSRSVKAVKSTMSLVDRQGDRQGRAEPLPVLPTNINGLDLSPNGEELAYVVHDGEGGKNVMVLELRTGRVRQLTEGFNFYPVWTPGGEEIVYAKEVGGQWDIYQRNAGSGTQPRLLLSDPVEENPSSFSEDGVLAYYRLGVDQGSYYDLWTLAPGDQQPKPFLETPAAEANPQFSPDGRWIAYEVWTRGSPEIYVRPFPSGSEEREWLVSAGNGRSPVWSPVEPELYYIQGEGSFMAVSYSTSGSEFSADSPVKLFEHPTWSDGFPSKDFDITPDGETFVVIDAPDLSETRVVVVENWFEELKQLVPVD